MVEPETALTHTRDTMKKYVSTPDVLLHGTGFTSIFTANEFREYTGEYEAVLNEYGVEKIEPEGWYPRQIYLDIFKRLSTKPNASTNMVSAGVRIIETIQLPPELQVNSMLEALELLNTVYQLDQRNVPADDIGYKITQEGPKHLRVIDYSPYPHDVNYGYIYGLVKRFSPKGIRPIIERNFLDANDPNGDGAVYDITWD